MLNYAKNNRIASLIEKAVRHERRRNPMNAQNYLNRMTPWLNVLPRFLRKTDSGLEYYGTGESAHWPVQSNQNILAALAVLARAETLENSPMSQEEIRDHALRLFRYSMGTHRTGKLRATDGKQWGHHWISVLGMERMTHGMNALRPFMTEEDCEQYKTVRLSEADFLTDEYPVVAGMLASTGNNRPESNIWNGGFLLRAATDYPDAARREEYIEKATAFLLNGISHPLDAASETLYRGRPLREWHKGFNFTPDFGLNHHGYLNIGYMVICLSNIAMLHFYFRELGQKAPEELYLHAAELWRLVKQCTFPDGRLLRIGGDSRARYTYCQNYALPAWLFAEDFFGDTDAVSFEENGLGIVETECRNCGDGGFLGKRLAELRDRSYYYFCRLESDQMQSLSYGAYWRSRFSLPEKKSPVKDNAATVWSDAYHGAHLLRANSRIRSWVWRGCQGPTGLCLPEDRSDLAEWQGSMKGDFSGNRLEAHLIRSESHDLKNGFLTSGTLEWVEELPLGEGEEKYAVIRHQCGIAALPDGETMLVLEYAEVIKECTLHSIRGMSLKVPNDVFNAFTREYRTPDRVFILNGKPGRAETIDTGSESLQVDHAFGIQLLYGTDSLKIRRSAEDNIIFHRNNPPWMRSLYADEICTEAVFESRRYLPGTVLLDSGFAVSAQGGRISILNATRYENGLRTIQVRGTDGFVYSIDVHFGLDSVELPGKDQEIFGAGKKISAGEILLSNRINCRNKQ